jgi:hypothetical protein
MYFRSCPDLDLPSAFTSTKAGDIERSTASQSEQMKEIDSTKRKDTAIKTIWIT